MPTPLPGTAAAMGSELRGASVFRAAVLAALGLASALAAQAADGPPGARSSYSCVLNGKKLVSDRVIPECSNVEQRELNADGSLKRIHRPTLTDDERADNERIEREKEAKRAAMNDAIRRDRNLTQRFPDEAAHKKAREKALDDLRISVKNSEARIAALMKEKKTLSEEAEFYPKPMALPNLLKQRVDANDALLEAQKSLAQNQQIDVARINALYDAELARLKKLWAGAPAGSLGPLPQSAPVPTAKLSSN